VSNSPVAIKMSIDQILSEGYKCPNCGAQEFTTTQKMYGRKDYTIHSGWDSLEYTGRETETVFVSCLECDADIWEEGEDPKELLKWEKLFLADCMGVGLQKQGDNDKHICFKILVEDDGSWFIQKGTPLSSFWLPELQRQLKAAEDWIRNNCVKDTDGMWEFK
jgi:hypothetical protein